MKHFYKLIIMLALIFSSVHLTYATDYYVSKSGNNTDGLSWSTAFTNLQSALTLAVNGDNVYVASGTFKPHASDNSVYFSLIDGVKLYGGFAGSETLIDQAVLDARDFSVNATILSGDLSSNDNTNIHPEELTRDDNTHHVIALDGSSTPITTATVIDGFTITGGNAFGTTIGDQDKGGGMWLKTASPTLKNLVFVKNTASGTFWAGGGLYVANSSPEISYCKFIGNVGAGSQAKGGAIALYVSTTNISNCEFYENETHGSLSGGSAILFRQSTGTISNSTFTENRSNGLYKGVPVYGRSEASITLINTLIWENYDDYTGAIAGEAVYAYPDVDLPTTINVSYSLLQNSGGSSNWSTDHGVDNGSNIDSNPLLIYNSTDYTSHLITGSPALGAGNATYGSNIGFYQGSGEQSSANINVTASLNSFGEVYVNNDSNPQSFSVSGDNLFEDISLTAPDGFKLSTDGNIYSQTLELTAGSGSVANTTIYVIFFPFEIKSYSGNIVIESLGASSQNVAVSGSGIEEPVVLEVTGTINDFGEVHVGNNATQQSIVISGSNLKGDVNVTVPAGFYISEYSNNFSQKYTSINLTHSNGIISDKTIYVTFAPTDEISYSGNLSISSLDATTQNIPVSGTGVVIPEIIKSVSVLNYSTVEIGQSKELSFTVSGLNLSDNILIESPENLHISLTQGDFSGQLNQLTLNQTDGAVSETTIYALYSPSDLNSFTGTINLSSTEATSQSINVSGQGVRPPFVFVKKDATGNNDGTSWVNAYTDLKTAMNTAGSTYTIVVAKGTYTTGSLTRTVSFDIINGMRLYGGFAGTEDPGIQASFDNRDFELNETILSGDVSGDDETVGNEENTYHVLRVKPASGGVGSNTIVDGFTVSNGNANIDGYSQENNRGGGLYISTFVNSNVSPSFRNIVFKGNTAMNGGAVYMAGVQSSGADIRPSFNDCVFENNSSYNGSGGAIYLSGIPGMVVEPEFDGILFVNNSATTNGGALYMIAGYQGGPGVAQLRMSNSTFYNNTCATGLGEAIHVNGQQGESKPLFYNVIVWNNDTKPIYNYVSSENPGVASPTFYNCLIEHSGGSDTWQTDLGNDGGNNITGDPMFNDPENGDFALMNGSPALYTGNQVYGTNIGYYQGAGVDGAPIISEIENVMICGSQATTINFTVSDGNTSTIELSAVSSNEGILPSSNITFGGDAGNRTLTVSPVNGVYGSTTITLTVLDESSNSSQITFTILFGEPISVEFEFQNNTCWGAWDASLSATVSSGTAPFTFSLDGNAEISSNYFSQLNVGDHYIKVRDAAGCEVISETYTVDEPEQLYVNGTIQQDITCYGGSNGELLLEAIGGRGNYTYSLGDDMWQNEGVFSNLEPGEYWPMVKDQAGCEAYVEQSLYFWNPDEIILGDLQINNATNGNNASINIEAYGGTGALTTSLNGSDFVEEFYYGNLSPGDYKLIIMDENSCSIDVEFSISGTTGMKDIEEFGVMVYPNPSNGVFNIELSQSFDNVQVELYDVVGNKCFSKTLSFGKAVENFTIDKPSGIYLLKIKAGDKESFRRLVLQ